MDFRVLLAVGMALGGSLAAPATGSLDGVPPGQVSHAGLRQTVAPARHSGHVLESSSFKSAVFRTIHYQRQAEGVPLGGGFDELPIERHLPVWVF
ncbi:hypothetical protein [Pseudomonas asplenii]|uniref:hypothetical protein n=1 Tax=Pseudomonas asplenii TaxID=53407 RepID=UPI0003825367|nr:hypothetical protein [Pseudomonas fuscovaginae]